MAWKALGRLSEGSWKAWGVLVMFADGSQIHWLTPNVWLSTPRRDHSVLCVSTTKKKPLCMAVEPRDFAQFWQCLAFVSSLELQVSVWRHCTRTNFVRSCAWCASNQHDPSWTSRGRGSENYVREDGYAYEGDCKECSMLQPLLHVQIYSATHTHTCSESISLCC